MYTHSRKHSIQQIIYLMYDASGYRWHLFQNKCTWCMVSERSHTLKSTIVPPLYSDNYINMYVFVCSNGVTFEFTNHNPNQTIALAKPLTLQSTQQNRYVRLVGAKVSNIWVSEQWALWKRMSFNKQKSNYGNCFKYISTILGQWVSDLCLNYMYTL